jgi:hypothetical protein
MADNIGQCPLYLSDEDILETRVNSRVVIIKKNHRSNQTGKTFQTYCPNGKESTKGAIPVVLQYNIWHQLSSKDKGPILEEPITEVHDYDIDKSALDVQALGEALETTAQQHVEDAMQAANEEKQCEQTDDESADEQDPINVRIRNSPIHTSSTQVFGKEQTVHPIMTMTTQTQTITQTTLSPTNPPMPTTTKV